MRPPSSSTTSSSPAIASGFVRRRKTSAGQSIPRRASSLRIAVKSQTCEGSRSSTGDVTRNRWSGLNVMAEAAVWSESSHASPVFASCRVDET